MYTNVNFFMFCDSFSDTYKDNFTYEGKRALFNYLENYEQEAGEDMELDTVALCCEFSEYDTLEELNANYSKNYSIEELQEKTTVIHCENGHLIVANF